MQTRRASDIPSSEITSESQYWNRRRFIETAAIAGAAASAGLAVPGLLRGASRDEVRQDENELTPLEDVIGYNNFYEFGTGKGDPARNAHTLRTRPWTVDVEGEVHKPQTFGIEDLWRQFPPEERVYRMRCVEAWSMVIPWFGFPLSSLLNVVEPTSHARFVEFTTLHDPQQMPGQRSGVLPWPYVEALRLDEANHPLTLLSLGLYGKALPNQNGAPVRLVVPWKYGFKSGKSIVRIRVSRDQPRTTWNASAPREYGFYANVNPEVDHPRWSQAMERRIGEFRRRDTLLFNGYADQVGHMYSGMDLSRYY